MGNSDSRTIFRDQIQILVNENITQDRYDFWDMLFSIKVSISDVYSMIPDADILNLIQNRKENIVRLFDFCVNIIEDMINSNDLKGNKATASSNALKFLSRIVPYFSIDHALLWDSEKRCMKLLKLCSRLLFLPGFTTERVGSEVQIDLNTIDQNRLWECGIKKPTSQTQTSSQTWSNRYDILKLILNIISFELNREYQSPCKNYAALFLVSESNEVLSQLFLSILNTIISSNPLGNWKLPYSSYFSVEFQEKTIQIGVHILSVLTYIKRNQFEAINDLTECEINSENLSQNILLKKFEEISGENELNLLYQSIRELIQIKIISQNTYLPASVKEISYQPEVVVFLWIMVKHNQSFKNYLATREDAYVIIPSIVQALSSSDFYIASISTYILLLLSTNRAFSCNLQHNFPSITTELPLFTGSYSDFLIIALTRHIFSSSSFYNPLNPYFLMIICNISPYVRSLCLLSCSSLVRLLEKYSTKSQIFESETSHFSLFYILESINNVIQYQWNAASGLILAVIRKRDIISKILALPSRWEESKEEEPSWKNKNWYEGWTKKLPFGVISGVLSYFIPELERYTKMNPNLTDENILNFITMSTLVGIIPPPSGIVIRNLELSVQSEFYESAYLWSFIYLRSLPLEVFPRDNIRLFRFS